MKQALLTYRRPLLGLLAPLIFVLSLLFSACQDKKPSSPAELLQAKQLLKVLRHDAGTKSLGHQLDSLEQIAHKYHDDSLVCAIRLKKIWYYLLISDLAHRDSLQRILHQQDMPSPALQFSWLAFQAIAGNTEPNIANMRQALAYADKHLSEVDSVLLTAQYLNITGEYIQTDKVDSIPYFLERAYRLAEERQDSVHLAHCYIKDAFIYEQALDDDKCAYYFAKALNYLQGQEDYQPIKNVTRLNFGQTLYNIIEMDRSRLSLRDSVEHVIKEMISSEDQHLNRGYILGHGHKLLGFLYTTTKEYDLAQKHLLIADSLTDAPDVKVECVKVNLTIKVNRGDKPYLKEAQHLEDLSRSSIGLITNSIQLDNYRILRRAYAEMGKTEDALRLNDSIDKYQDSIRAENKYREVAKLERGRALREAKAQVQSERRGKHQLLWWLAGTGLVACLAIATLYIYNRRRRRRLEEECRLLHESLAQSQEEQERSAKNLELIKEKMRQTMLQEEQEPSPSEGQRLKLSTEAQETIAEGLREFVQGRGYLDKSLSLDSLSELIGTNRAYLSAYMNQVLGCSYSDYVAKLRLEEAKRLLLQTDYTIETIALSTGFTVKATFINAFKKHNEGLTPSAYRSRHRQ